MTKARKGAGWEVWSSNLGPESSIFEAELKGIARGLEIDPEKAVITDSQASILKILEMQKTGWASTEDLVKIAKELSKDVGVDEEGNFTNLRSIFWTKGHKGLEGNERADQAAKRARLKEQDPQKVSYFGIVHRDRTERKEARNNIGYGKGKIVDIPRKLATIYTQLRTNRGPFNSWLKTIRKVDTELCENHGVKDDAGHRLRCHIKEVDWEKEIKSWENFDSLPELSRAKYWNLLPTALDLEKEKFTAGIFMSKGKGKRKESEEEEEAV